MANAIRKTVGETIESGYRPGGDEFARLLPDSEAREAGAVVGRLHALCARRSALCAAPLAFSAGMALDYAESVAQLLQRADRALYAEKRGHWHVS